MTKTILVVEDDNECLVLLDRLLRSSGYNVLCARNGKEAMRKVAEEFPDLVMLDIGLPERDGFEVCRFLKGDGRTERIPVIMLTGRNYEEDLTKGLGEGADCFISKPFSSDDLVAEIKHYVGQ